MPKTNARQNRGTRKQAKMRVRNRALRESIQGRLKTMLKPNSSAAVTPAK
jgi:hypothetical protein